MSVRPRSRRCGQALTELTVALMVLVVLTVAAAQLARLCVHRVRMRQEARAEVGLNALRARADGVAGPGRDTAVAVHPMNRVNAYTRLGEASLPRLSHLPASHYTLQTRLNPDDELGLVRGIRSECVTVNEAFTDLIWPKGTVLLREEALFPTLSGLAEPTAAE